MKQKSDILVPVNLNHDKLWFYVQHEKWWNIKLLTHRYWQKHFNVNKGFCIKKPIHLQQGSILAMKNCDSMYNTWKVMKN